MTVATPSTIKRALPVIRSSHDECDLPGLSRLYAHGELEDRMGWDCLCGSLEMAPGIHPCVFVDEDGAELSALAFVWQDSTMPVGIPVMGLTGIVALKGDADAVRHAMEMMLKGQGC